MAGNKKVALALSGGIDSFFAGYILLQRGYKVEAFTLKIPFLPDDYLERASLLCDRLGISHHIIDVEKKFREEIVKYFISSYLGGVTPNPCVKCNRNIKFGLLFKEIKKRNFDLLATGHYVSIVEKGGMFYMKKAAYESNSQEYFLALVPKNTLKHCLFPLGGYSKRDVLNRVGEMYPFSISPSREICFVRNRDYRKFIASFIEDNSLYKGLIRYYDGKVLKEHNGIYNYTYGQRCGLGVSWGFPLYVCDINPHTKDVIVAEKDKVFTNTFYVSGINWFYPASSYGSIFVRLRYNARLLPCRVEIDGERVLCVLTKDKDIPSPGQLACFYDKDKSTVIAGGVIEKSVRGS